MEEDYLYIYNHKKLNQMDNDLHLKFSLDDRYIFIVKHRSKDYEVHLLRNGEDSHWKLEIGDNRTKIVKKINKRDIQHLSSFVFWLNSIVREWVIEDNKNHLIMMAQNYNNVPYHYPSSTALNLEFGQQ